MEISGIDLEIIPNGIDLAKYSSLPLKGQFRKKYSIKNNEKLILYLGRLHSRKGIDLLISAFSQILKELGDARLIIAGPDNGFLPAIKRQMINLNLGDKILLTGPLYEKDKVEAFVDADIYVLPSIYEAFPVSVLEAWACCKPVVVTTKCGIVDYVKEAGAVVEYDENQLRDSIIRILKDEGLKKQFGFEGRLLVEEKFNWDKIIKKIEDLYTIVSAVG